MFGGSDFSSVERNFTIGQSPKIWGNFSKIFLNMMMANLLKTLRRAEIYAGFFGWGGSTKCLGGPIFRGWNEIFRGSTKCLGGPIFRGWNEILLLGKALKSEVIFQNLSLKLIKICKIIWKIREKCKFLGKSFKIFWPGIIF